jgi:hypothetical protein
LATAVTSSAPIPTVASASTDRGRSRRIRLIELGIAEPEPGIEQHHALAVPDRIDHHHAPPHRGTVLREPEVSDLDRHDLRDGLWVIAR